jgi:bacteriorhodopsin
MPLTSTGSPKVWLWVVVAVVIAMVVAGVVLFLLFRRKKSRTQSTYYEKLVKKLHSDLPYTAL